MKTIIGKRNIIEINSEYVLKIGEKAESVRPKRLLIERFVMKKLEKYGMAVPKVLNYGTFVDDREYMKIKLVKGEGASSKDLSIDLSDIYKNVGNQLRKAPLEFKRFGWINPVTLDGEFATWNEYLYDFVQRYGLRLYRRGILKKSQIAIILKYIKKLPDNFKMAGFVHRDLKPQNLIFSPRDKRVYILDWENVILGDPLLDLAILKTNFENPKIYRGFIRGFLNRPLNNVERKSVDLYSVIAIIGTLNFNLKNNLSLSGIYTLNEQIEKLKYNTI
ncbi:MAG: hypothetical protein C0412_18745 [Flavobacterium sp.]|nr:hypothetical protein [Flavobacterium sp.]